jgi:hypothetical protein
MSSTNTADLEIRRDFPLSHRALLVVLCSTGFFIWIGSDSPEHWRLSQQYILGIMLITAAVIVHGQFFPYARAAEAFKQAEFARLRAAWEENANTLMALNPRSFEDAVARLFRQLGYVVQQTPYSGDEGRDAIAKKDGRTFLIEMKRYSPDRTVGRPILMKLHSAMVSANADGGILVTTSRFTKPAATFAQQKGIRLIDGDELGRIVSQAYPNPANPNVIRAVCKRCGRKIAFPLNGDATPSNCPNGHAVEHPIPRSRTATTPSKGFRGP